MKSNFKNPSFCSLLISDLLIIYFSIKYNWNLFDIIWVYVFQGVIVLFFYGLKAFILKQLKEVLVYIRVFSILFAIYFYGLFFITVLFNSGIINFYKILTGAIIFFLSHLFSFFYNLRDKQNDKKIYLIGHRIFPIHIIMIVAGIVGFNDNIQNMSQNIKLIIAFVAIKTLVDIKIFNYEQSEDELDKILNSEYEKQKEFEEKAQKFFNKIFNKKHKKFLIIIYLLIAFVYFLWRKFFKLSY